MAERDLAKVLEEVLPCWLLIRYKAWKVNTC